MKILKTTLCLLFAALLSLTIILIATDVYVPLPTLEYDHITLPDKTTLDSKVKIKTYARLDAQSNVDFKGRILIDNPVALVQTVLSQQIPLGKKHKSTGIRIWLDEVTVRNVTANNAELLVDLHLVGRVATDFLPSDTKHRDFTVRLDLGFDAASQRVVVTCNLGNIQDLPGDVETVFNDQCRYDQPLQRYELALQSIGYRFVAMGPSLAVDVIGKCRPYAFIRQLLRSYLTEQKQKFLGPTASNGALSETVYPAHLQRTDQS